jgi:Protein of unknown function (DUF2442)
MGSLVSEGPSYVVVRPPGPAKRVLFDRGKLFVELADGREIGAPLAWFPRLQEATEAQRAHWEIVDFGLAIHWPDIDEDLSVAGLLGLSD